MSEWLPIESAPKDGTEIDVWCWETAHEAIGQGYRVPNAYWSTFDEKWLFLGGGSIGWAHSPAHWMPLPAPPGRNPMTDNPLPELPEAQDLAGFMPEGHDDAAMRAYGQQCYAAGVAAERERAARLALAMAADQHYWAKLHLDCDEAAGEDIAAAIRKG
jgi:hypothetical protein